LGYEGIRDAERGKARGGVARRKRDIREKKRNPSGGFPQKVSHAEKESGIVFAAVFGNRLKIHLEKKKRESIR